MRKKILFFLISILISGFGNFAAAQQLFINEMEVYDGGGVYCTGGDVVSKRSFIGDALGNPPGVNDNVWAYSSLIEFERPKNSYPGACLSLCASIQCVRKDTGVAFGVDSLSFEIFKFSAGTNPLDPASSPPLKTVFLYNVNDCDGDQPSKSLGTYCTSWDGSYNLNGKFGKTNGQYGFRAKVETNQVSPTVGNIVISQTSAFPGVNQIPIQIDVTNVHAVRSSPTVIGNITAVAAQPYNLLYRLSKDATTTIKIYAANQSGGTLPLVRTVIDHLPRVGEGTPDGTLTNGDFWDGRNNNGQIVSAGIYLAVIEAETQDMWSGTDLSWPTTIQIGLDPLQITDVALKPLGPSSTDVAIISYLLTEAATVYVDIYPPETTFGNVNSFNHVPSEAALVSIVEQKESRKAVSTYWDGRDKTGNFVCDGNYVYSIRAELPSGAGTIQTQRTMVGAIPVARGLVVTFLKPSSTVIGSTPSVAGLNPFYFKYTPIREAIVTANIRDMSNNIVRTLADNEIRFANFENREIWDGKDNSGVYVSSGIYVFELQTIDPFQCATQKISTATVIFPSNMFRLVNVKTSPLLGGTSDMAAITFELSQTMWTDLKIYKPSEVSVSPADWPWDSGIYETVDNIVYRVNGMRPGRFRITEYWDGRDKNGLLVEDGQYPFSLIAYSTGTVAAMYATDKTYGYVNVTRGKIIFNSFDVIPTIPTMYNSSDVVKLPPYEITYGVSRQSSVKVEITNNINPPLVIATVLEDGIRDGDITYTEYWDGKKDNGDFVDGGDYNVRVVAQDISSQLTSLVTVQMTIDVYPLRIYDVSIYPLVMDEAAIITYQVSEAMKTAIKIYKPGTYFNNVGEPLPIESSSLVKRIIGVRPARTQIMESWDGTDLSLAKVPDGNYIFKIYGSTDTNGIDTLTGKIGNGVVIADDIVTSNLPVTKGGTADVCGDFSSSVNTFFAPNPYTGTSGYFKIWVPITGDVSLRVYNIAGDLIFKNKFENQPGDSNVPGACKGYYCWPKTNLSGRTVTHGVYYYVLRFEATEGTREVCQVTKKILIP